MKRTIRWKHLLFALTFIFAGAAGLASINWTMEVTSSEAFCISCHEMNNHAFAELQDTIHYSNRTGTRADCAACHVPQDTIGKIGRKIEAIREVYGKITGKINTPEKYEAHRLAMAEKVWADMRANDSQACRHCHINFESSLDQQYQWARQNHQRAIRDNLTCIDCHQGIAHQLPNSSLMIKPLSSASDTE